MFELGRRIFSTYDQKVRGPIVGYGTLSWPNDYREAADAVYIIQIAKCSSSLGPACAVVRASLAIPEDL